MVVLVMGLSEDKGLSCRGFHHFGKDRGIRPLGPAQKEHSLQMVPTLVPSPSVRHDDYFIRTGPFRYSVTRKRNSPLARVGKSPGASDSSVARTITSELRMRFSNTGGAASRKNPASDILLCKPTPPGVGVEAGSTRLVGISTGVGLEACRLWPAGIAPAGGLGTAATRLVGTAADVGVGVGLGAGATWLVGIVADAVGLGASVSRSTLGGVANAVGSRAAVSKFPQPAKANNSPTASAHRGS